jgi:catalase (peroxidase I)
VRDLLHNVGADVIAIGAIMAVNTCGGPIIPLHGGRVDVWAAQSSDNTPVPEDPIQTLQESFRNMGFSATEMIALTACGHTIGGVRSSDFPQLVPPNTNYSVPVINDFDTTTAFDNAM